MNERLNARRRLARELRQSSDHSSEQELRDALSRSYYSLYHASIVLLKLSGKRKRKFSHEELPGDVGNVHAEWKQKLETLRDLRNQVDYDPDFVARRYMGDLRRFREDAFKNLEAARELFGQLENAIDEADRRMQRE